MRCSISSRFSCSDGIEESRKMRNRFSSVSALRICLLSAPCPGAIPMMVRRLRFFTVLVPSQSLLECFSVGKARTARKVTDEDQEAPNYARNHRDRHV